MATTTPLPSEPITSQEKEKIESTGATPPLLPPEEFKHLISALPLAHHVVPVRHYQGYWWPEATLPGVIAVQRYFQPRPDDIFIATYPKSGTTWLKSLAFAVSTRSRYPLSSHPLLSLNPHRCVPSLERAFNRGYVAEVDALPSPRLIATHMLCSALPESITADSSGNRIVYCWRDPKDVVVSAWYFGAKVLGSAAFQAEWPVDRVALAVCQGKAPHASIWDHILGYWQERVRRPGKVLFLRYEEMVAEPEASVRRLAEFLGCPFSAEEEAAGAVEGMVRLCSFKNLSGLAVNNPTAIGEASRDEEARAKVEHNATFFRKGEVGDWRNHMSTEVARRMDEVTMNRFHGSGLSFN